jgi:hypothetical protein
MNVGFQNLVVDQPFLRSSQDWTESVPTVQNKDGWKIPLSFHGMHLLPCISEAAIYSLSIDHCVLPHRSHSMFNMIIAYCVQEMTQGLQMRSEEGKTWKKTGDFRRRNQEFRSFISHIDNLGDKGLGIEMKMSCCPLFSCFFGCIICAPCMDWHRNFTSYFWST